MLLGGLLDLGLGEPANRWHPVCWMGKAVDLADWAAPGRERSGRSQRVSGLATAFLLPSGTYLLARRFLKSLPWPLSMAAGAGLASTAIATRSLFEQARKVEEGLFADLEVGRREVGRMVGRDVDGLDEVGVIRAAVESVAENANDGVIAPIFYGLIGGAPLALAYKTINTLDSMIGYRDEQYLYFGWMSARIDDVAGFIPARLTAFSAAILSPLVKGSPMGALSVWRRDASLHDSPNAGVCESAYAGALGVQLGGPGSYAGKPVAKAFIGEGLRPPAATDITRAARLMGASSALVLVLGATVRAGVVLTRFFLRRRRG